MFIRSGYSAQTLSVRSVTEDHHRAADVVGGRRDPVPGGVAEAGGEALTLERVPGQPVEPDAVLGHGADPVGSHPLASALQHEAIAVVAYRGRLARVDDPIAFDHVRQWCRPAVGRLVGL